MNIFFRFVLRVICLDALVLLSSGKLAPRQKNFRKVLQWVEDLPKPPKAYKIDFHDDGEITLHAWMDIPAENAIFAIPIKKELNSKKESRLANNIRNQIDADSSLPEIFFGRDEAMKPRDELEYEFAFYHQMYMMGIILEEFVKGKKSEFSPYIKVLPRDFPTMVLHPDFDEHHLAWVESQGDFAHQIDKEKRKYEAVVKVLKAAIEDMHSARYDKIDDDKLRWVYYTVKSRTFAQEPHEEDGKLYVAMTPLIDMLNHRKNPNVEVSRTTFDDEPYVVVRSLIDLVEGDELFMQYCEEDEIAIFLSYGFGLEPPETFISQRVEAVGLEEKLIDEVLDAKVVIDGEFQ